VDEDRETDEHHRRHDNAADGSHDRTAVARPERREAASACDHSQQCNLGPSLTGHDLTPFSSYYTSHGRYMNAAVGVDLLHTMQTKAKVAQKSEGVSVLRAQGTRTKEGPLTGISASQGA
jgi:hypothetical protein